MIPGVDAALARLAQVRLERERHETAIWCLEREADELRAQIRLANAKAPGVGNDGRTAAAEAVHRTGAAP
jgi:hypothetical protein